MKNTNIKTSKYRSVEELNRDIRLLKPGQHLVLKGLPEKIYHGQEVLAVSQSTLKAFQRNPANVPHLRNTPRAHSDAASIGSAVHMILLEGWDAFHKAFVVKPADIKLNTKIGKEKYAEFLTTVDGREVLSHSDFATIERMAKSVISHQISGYMNAEDTTMNELSVFYREPETDLLLKGRFDCISDKSLDGNRIVIDLKTTTEISKFKRSFLELGYHFQAAFYSMLHERVFGEQCEFVFLAVAKNLVMGIHEVNISKMSIDSLKVIYAEDIQPLLARYKECHETDTWPMFADLDIKTQSFDAQSANADADLSFLNVHDEEVANA